MSWHEAFKSRSDLERFGSNAIGLFAMALRFKLEDLETVASEAIVDSPDDKKCDIVYVNSEERYGVVAQCYLSQVLTRSAAKSDKAADLNTAIAWLLDADIQSIPLGLRPSAIALRTAFSDGLIDDLYVWYSGVYAWDKNNSYHQHQRGVYGLAGASYALDSQHKHRVGLTVRYMNLMSPGRPHPQWVNLFGEYTYCWGQ